MKIKISSFLSIHCKYHTLTLIIFNAVFLWVFFSFSRENLNSPDMFENYVWGMAWTLGNNKHPPLFGWITAIWFTFFPTKAWAGYLLSEFNLFAALLFLRKAMLEFIDEEKVFIAIALTIVTLSLGMRKGWEYNANLAQLPFITGYMWALVKAYKIDDKKYVVLAGFFAAASILCKYSALLLLAGITLGIWIFLRPRIKKIISYLALEGIIILVILTPHIFWESQHHFPAIEYMHGKHSADPSQSMAAIIGDRLLLSFNFAVISFVIFTLSLFHQTRLCELRINQPNRKTIGLNIFLLSCLSIIAGSIIEGLKPDLGWFIVGTIFIGWALVDLAPININWPLFKKDITVLLLIYFASVAVYCTYHIQQIKSRKMIIEAVPERISKDLTNLFHERFNDKIRYVGGTFPFAYALAFYSEDHPSSIFSLDLSNSPWVSESDFLRGSKVIICGNQKQFSPIEPYCSQESIKRFGPPNDIAFFIYDAFDPISKSHVTYKFKALMYINSH